MGGVDCETAVGRQRSFAERKATLERRANSIHPQSVAIATVENMQRTVDNRSQLTAALVRAVSAKHPKAKVRLGSMTPGQMNKTEKRYAQHLEALKHAGVIADYEFGVTKRRLADLTWYEPDFEVYLDDGTVEYHEVKGCMNNGKVLVEEDANVKIKVAAERFPRFQFVRAAWFEKGKRWKFHNYGEGKSPIAPEAD